MQTGGELGLSAPATWIRIPSTPRLTDQDWLAVLEVPSLSVVKAKPATFLEHWVLGERRTFAMTFNEVRGRPLFRMYLAHRDRLVQLGDAPAEMVVSFSESHHLKIDTVAPTIAVRGVSETAESTETVSLFLDSGEGIAPQRLSVQYGYFSRAQAAAVFDSAPGLARAGLFHGTAHRPRHATPPAAAVRALSCRVERGAARAAGGRVALDGRARPHPAG